MAPSAESTSSGPLMTTILLIPLVTVIFGQWSVAVRHLDTSCLFQLELFNESLHRAPIVLSATALNVSTDPDDRQLQIATVKIKRVFKGRTTIGDRRKIVINGLGDRQICSSSLRERETKIILLNELNGLFYLNSSLMPINLSILDTIDSLIRGAKLKKRRHIKRTKCEEVRCPYGAKCNPFSAQCECKSRCNVAGPNVCGTDNVSYISECHLSVRSCLAVRDGGQPIRVKSVGSCERRNPCEELRCAAGEQCVIAEESGGHMSAHCVCPRHCDQFGDSVQSLPVCATDGTDFTSICHLRRHACDTGRNISVKYYGKCDPCKEHDCPLGTVCKLDTDRRPECRCSTQCGMHSEPVCASDGNTYENECLMMVSACRRDVELRVHSRRRCNDVNSPCQPLQCADGEVCEIRLNGTATCKCAHQLCPQVMKPVCAVNGKTYDNECEMHRHACLTQINNAVRHFGTCGLGACAGYDGCVPPKVCVDRGGRPVCDCELCGSYLSEVCASNGLTYPNECKMRRDACLSGRVIYQKYSGICDGCVNVRCDFYSVCVSDDRGNGHCRCPEGCPESKNGLTETVCATDGVSYRSECLMRLSACRQQKFIVVAFSGSCENGCLTECKPDEQCVHGQCQWCPDECPEPDEQTQKVCGTDGNAYWSECHLRMTACRSETPIGLDNIRNCEQSRKTGGGSVGRLPAACDWQTCSFGGFCVSFSENDDDPDVCMCNFNCAAPEHGTASGPDRVDWYICANDGQFYESHCRMDLASCQQQKPIYEIAPMPFCYYSDDCGCNRVGSTGDQCDSNGQCECRQGVTGKKCDQCISGLWGLHLIAKGANGCQPCGCSVFGSSRSDCEQSTGQCQCKAGAHGFKCDSCAPDSLMTANGCAKRDEFRAPENCEQLVCHHGARCEQSASGIPDCICPESCSSSHLGGIANISICATNGITYKNYCELKQFACKHQLDLTISLLGDCQKDGATNSDDMVIMRRMARNRQYLGNLCLDDSNCRISNAICGWSPENRLRVCQCRSGFFATRDLTQCLQDDSSGTGASWRFDGESGFKVTATKLKESQSLTAQFQIEVKNSTEVIMYAESKQPQEYILLMLSGGRLSFSFKIDKTIYSINAREDLNIGMQYLIKLVVLERSTSIHIDNWSPILRRHPNRRFDFLNEPIYIGFIPLHLKRFPADHIPHNYSGCISNIVINGKPIEKANVIIVGTVDECPSNHCDSAICKNGGTCVWRARMPKCLCDSNFNGEFCERKICPDNEFCGHEELITGRIAGLLKESSDLSEPLRSVVTHFVGNGCLMIQSAGVLDVRSHLEIEIKLSASHPDGLIFYWANTDARWTTARNGDFVALLLIAWRPCFIWNLGSGTAHITLNSSISDRKFHIIRFGRNLRRGHLNIDISDYAYQLSPAKYKHLNVNDRQIFLGGIPEGAILPKAIPQLPKPFEGIVTHLTINGHNLANLFENSRKFGKVRIVTRNRPIKEDNRSGTKTKNNNLSNNKLCKSESIDDTNYTFFLDGFTERYMLKKPNLKSHLNYEFQIRSNSSSGLIWLETSAKSNQKNQFAIFMLAGRMAAALRFRNDRQFKTLGSNRLVDDDRWHIVRFTRQKRKLLFSVDEETTSITLPAVWNASFMNSIIWIGGTNSNNQLRHLSDFIAFSPFIGCIRNVKIAGQLIELETIVKL